METILKWRIGGGPKEHVPPLRSVIKNGRQLDKLIQNWAL